MPAPETRDLLDEFILISRMEAPEQSPPAGAALVAEMTFGDVQTDYSPEPLVDVDARRNVRTVLRGADECVLELDIQHRGLVKTHCAGTKDVVGARNCTARMLELGDRALRVAGCERSKLAGMGPDDHLGRLKAGALERRHDVHPPWLPARRCRETLRDR